MPWSTPTLRAVRSLVRDAVNASLPGADAAVPNSVLRVLSDNQGALCHLTLQYIDWLALQLLPDTAEAEWLDRHGKIWLVNADGTTGRKMATLAAGTGSFAPAVLDGTIIPAGTQLQSPVGMPVGPDSQFSVVTFETLEEITVSTNIAVTGNIRALDPGSFGNLAAGTTLTIYPAVVGASTLVTVLDLTGGTDTETDDELRARILKRIQSPPMGGDKTDYEQWALAVPGVTRAWASPQEMGIGTMTVRFLMDDLRASDDGWPTAEDIQAVKTYLDKVRPVTVKDLFVVAPVKQFIDCQISELVPDTDEAKAEIEQSLRDMLHQMAAPGQTIFAAWKSYAIMNAPSAQSFKLDDYVDDVMPSPGHMAVLGDIIYE